MIKTYKRTLKNGLTILMVPDETKNMTQAKLMVNYGAAIRKIRANNKTYQIPFGLAHLLEHNIVENSIYDNAIAYFNQNYVASNAYTTDFRTMFYIDVVCDFEKHLEELITMVNKPLFTNKLNEIKKPIYEEIKMNLASSAESVFFEDFFEDGIMNKNDFAFVDAETPEKNICGNYVDFMQGHKKFSEVFNQVHQYGFDEKEVMNVCTITVIFHDISRPISMQIIRHRNGISQESQRYVDYSTKSFIDPMQYTKDENKDKTYSVALFGINKSMKSKDLGNELMQVYKQLTRQGMLKQDARGFLPSNVCTKLMMTFTYSTFFHFLNNPV